ncbi:hypothetical protein HW555_009247 [Spodoptera exigua]|uniref:Gustatory receptor n=1 Tax=Spodoptera exigua TaxID=7107 RepID=A0A835L0Y3_SPOEX|nr:hypothetical protein HW555_009247 [Spodoptera exigua]
MVSSSVEAPLKFHLKKPIRQLFYPFHLLLFIFLSPKFLIIDNCITANGKRVCIVTALAVIFFISITFYRFALSKIVSWNIIILTIIWLLKDIVLVFLQNFFSEKFYMTVEEAETTCMLLMKNKHCTRKSFENKFLILFHTVDTFFRCLFYFTLVLQVLTMLDNVQTDRRVVILSVSLVLSVVWLSKDVMLVMIQSMQCEKFYITIEKAETACIQRLKNKHYLDVVFVSDCERNLCKDMVQLNRVSFSKMSACGLFYIDGTLPLQLMGILTNYIVVILQTMFL